MQVGTVNKTQFCSYILLTNYLFVCTIFLNVRLIRTPFNFFLVGKE